MQRRDFIKVLAGSAMTCPLAARAQRGEHLRHLGMLMTQAEDDPNGQARSKTFLQALEQLGWSSGRNLLIEYRWSAGDSNRIRKDAADLVANAPDVLLTNGAAGVAPLLQETRNIPIVFVLVADPVGAGFVDSLAHPGGNATGFSALEYSSGSKWVELLKEIASGVARVAIVRDPAISAGIGLFGAIQSAAASLSLEVVSIDVRDTAQIEGALAAFARVPNGGMVVTASASALSRRDALVTLAAQHKLPAVYFARDFVAAGGLAAYAPDSFDQYRRAAGYIDRILKGEKPAELPVQAPTKYEVVINLKTAKALGLTVPQSLLATADEVIE
jgi:putative tryptophan/tyrosine transport system substrate-binding protein